MPDMILLLNHELSENQIKDAVNTFGIKNFIYPPDAIRKIWMGVNPKGDDVTYQLDSVMSWLEYTTKNGDFILVQGEYGAAFFIVDYCFKTGLIPVYATSERQYAERKLIDGSVERKHVFKHIQFRRYKVWEKKKL